MKRNFVGEPRRLFCELFFNSPIFESLTTLSSFFLNLFEAEQDGEEQNTAYVVQLDFV